MSNIDFLTLRLFCLVAKTKSIKRAASVIGMERTTASKRITQLETLFNDRLFLRELGGVFLTKTGNLFYKKALKAVNELKDLENFMISEHPESFKVRIASTHSLVSIYLSNILPKYIKSRPEVAIEIFANDSEVNIEEECFDISIESRINNSPEVVQKKLLTWEVNLYASANYLESHPPIEKITDLKEHRIITFGDEIEYPFGYTAWPLQFSQDDEKSRIIVNSVQAMLQLAEGGAGIIGTSQYIIDKTGSQLIKLLPQVSDRSTESYVTYRKSKESKKAVMDLVEYILQNPPSTTHVQS